MNDYELVAEKRPWVPEWLWRIACHWMPLAEMLSWPPRCQWPCVLPATHHVYGRPPDYEYLGALCDYHGNIVRAEQLGRMAAEGAE